MHQAWKEMVGTSEAALVICLNDRLASINSAQGPGEAFSGLNAPTGMASTTSSKSERLKTWVRSLLFAPIGFKIEPLQRLAILNLPPPGRIRPTFEIGEPAVPA